MTSLIIGHGRISFKVLDCFCFLPSQFLYAVSPFENKNFIFLAVWAVKSNGSYLQPSKSSYDPVVLKQFEYCAHSARLLRKLDHVLLWILSTDTGDSDSALYVQSKEISMTSNVSPLHFAPSQASWSQNSNVDNF